MAMVQVFVSLIVSLGLLSSATAEVPWLTTTSQPIPEVHPGESFPLAQDVATHLGVVPVASVRTLASALETQFERALAPLAQPSPKCVEPAGADYAYALFVAGRLTECAAYARTCVAEPQLTSPEVLLQGAICEAQSFRWREADELFQAATAEPLRGSPQAALAVSHYVAFALANGFDDRVEAILARHPQWSEGERGIVRALLARAARLDTGAVDRAAMDQFLEKWRAQSQGRLAEFLTVLKARIEYNEGRYSSAMTIATSEFPQLHDPMSWYYLAFMTFYHGLDKQFGQARVIYEAYDRFAQPWWQLPIENNVFTYSEIYSQECQSTTLQGSDRASFDRLKASLRKGQITIERALIQMRDWQQRFPDRADVLSALGGMLSLLGHHDEAEQHLWQAHRLCRYFNRAHWGLALTWRTRKFISLPDYQQNEQRMQRELGGIGLPPAADQYFINWRSFDGSALQRVVFGARIYVPHLEFFASKNLKAFLKFSYDLLSESPGNTKLRDQRIGGGKYPNDHRLWDDVRGAGGETVVADIHEVLDSPHGSYNLLGHEMAHQLQTYMSYVFPQGVERIRELYQEALVSGNFPDKYSSQNMEEHFAQGVTYFLVPTDAPTRFGLNRSWLTRHNQAQEQFIVDVTKTVPGLVPPTTLGLSWH